METNLEKLIELQSKIGYVAGSVHPVAMLGLMGECGEVAVEAMFITAENPTAMANLNNKIGSFSIDAWEIDSIKKFLRKTPISDLTVEINEAKFDAELSDAFYYLLAVATGRNLTIEDLARMGYDKVIAKRGSVQAGDPAR